MHESVNLLPRLHHIAPFRGPKSKFFPVYRDKSIPMTALWCPAFSNHG